MKRSSVKQIPLTSNLTFSRIVHGHWRLRDWKLSKQELLKLTGQAMELGITTFDHADIYGDFSCEKLFGDAMTLKRELRNEIQIITKCGIQPVSAKFPGRKTGIYDYSKKHIIRSVENSLVNFRTDYIDLLLLHRPSPLLDPVEVAEAFRELKQNGKVLYFGVSNFTPGQFEMLQSFLDDKLVTNQVEISPFCLEHFENGNMDFFLKEQIKPMAWSPLGGGKTGRPKTEKEQRIVNILTEVARELKEDSIDKVAYAWLLKHPASVIPIAGTGKIERLKLAVEALDIEMSLEQWFKIYTASTGEKLP